MDKPHIEYPCIWTYKIIGQDEQLLRIAAINAVQGKMHKLEPSNQSSGGKYQSLSLELEVNSDDERIEIFNKLKQDHNVKIVI